MSIDFKDSRIDIKNRQVETALSILPGDHLTFDELEARFDQLRDQPHLDLIDGKVYMTPRRYLQHDGPLTKLSYLLSHYVRFTPGVESCVEATLFMEQENGPSPDICLWLEPDVGGQTCINDRGYLTGAPELIIEIAASSASYDLYEKKDLYERLGVREYLVWRTEERAIDVFEMRGNSFQRVDLRPEDQWKSRVFAGLVIDLPAIVKLDYETAYRTLESSIALPEHQEFCKLQLTRRQSSEGTK